MTRTWQDWIMLRTQNKIQLLDCSKIKNFSFLCKTVEISARNLNLCRNIKPTNAGWKTEEDLGSRRELKSCLNLKTSSKYLWDIWKILESNTYKSSTSALCSAWILYFSKSLEQLEKAQKKTIEMITGL